MSTLIIIPCSKRKVEGGINLENHQNLFGNDNLQVLRNERIGIFNDRIINPNLVKPAWERYDGHLYRNLPRVPIRDRIDDGSLNILIISGLYGMLRYNDLIPEYNVKIAEGGLNFWGNSLAANITEYIENYDIDNVFYSLSQEYNIALQPHPHWNRIWAPEGTKGIYNIYNMVIPQLTNIIEHL